MTRDPITLLTRTLADRADAVAAPPAGLADAAARQVRARRRHQVVGATVGAVAVAAVVASRPAATATAPTVAPTTGCRRRARACRAAACSRAVCWSVRSVVIAATYAPPTRSTSCGRRGVCPSMGAVP